MRRNIFVVHLSLLISSAASFCSCNNTGQRAEEVKLYPVVSNDRVGYIDRDGKMVIAPQFAEGIFFTEHKARVRSIDGRYGFIDETRKYVINPRFATAGVFSEGLAAVVPPDGHCQYVDPTGKVVFTLNDADIAGTFHNGLAFYLDTSGKWGFVDKSGRHVIAPQFDAAGDFSDKLAPVGT